MITASLSSKSNASSRLPFATCAAGVRVNRHESARMTDTNWGTDPGNRRTAALFIDALPFHPKADTRRWAIHRTELTLANRVAPAPPTPHRPVVGAPIACQWPHKHPPRGESPQRTDKSLNRTCQSPCRTAAQDPPSTIGSTNTTRPPAPTPLPHWLFSTAVSGRQLAVEGLHRISR